MLPAAVSRSTRHSNDLTEIVVFEMKAAWLREGSLLDASGEEFVRQLRRKYGVLAADGALGEHPKVLPSWRRSSARSRAGNGSDLGSLQRRRRSIL